MVLQTLLVNETKKSYVIIGYDYPTKTGFYLQRLEKLAGWNLVDDYISIRGVYKLDGFFHTKVDIYGDIGGGEIIHEKITLFP
jgi:hypothetical protein